MSYIGNKPATSFETVQKQISTSNSGTTITLDRAVTSVQDILLTIDAVVQSYDNYSVSGTTLTVGGTLNNNRVEILYVGRTMQSVDPTDSSVSTAKIQNDAVTKDKVDFVTDSGGASLEAKGSSGYDGAVRLNCSVNSHYTELKSASHGSYSGNLSFTLPSSTGTNGQFLQTNGSGVLSFANAGGTHVLLGSSASGSGTSSVSFNNVFSSTYDQYLILAHRLTTNDNNENIYVRMRASSSDFTSSNYNYIITGNKSSVGTGTSGINFGYNNQPQFMFTRGIENTDAQGGGALSFHLFDPYDGTFYTRAQGVSSIRKATTGDIEVYTLGGQVESTTQFDGISIYPSGGTFAQHEVYIYGIKES